MIRLVFSFRVIRESVASGTKGAFVQKFITHYMPFEEALALYLSPNPYDEYREYLRRPGIDAETTRYFASHTAEMISIDFERWLKTHTLVSESEEELVPIRRYFLADPLD